VPARYQDWLRQAKRDLAHAERSVEDGDFEWACFAAQQSAEKGVKSLFLRMAHAAWGHSVAGLLQELPEPWQADSDIIDAGKELDKHYIPPRYPNSYPQGAPYDYYTRAEAERAIHHTSAILSFCERVLAGLEGDSHSAETSSDATGGGAPGD
jgi:HEPN domain-containing protein